MKTAPDRDLPGRDQVVKSAFQFRDALISHAFALVRDWSVSEDVVQDAFIVVMNKWEDFRPGTSVFHWVRQIVHLKTMEALRSRARRMTPAEEELLERVAGAVRDCLGEDAAERQRVMRQALQHCMSRLGERGLELVSGFYGRSESCEALAVHQKRSVNAVRLALSRLRKQLHECMSRRLPALEARG